ncbi:MAG: glycosyltransferase family 4 protein [Longimicrobiales bacterium]
MTSLISMEGLSGPGRQLAAFALQALDHGVRVRVAILHRTGNPTPAFARALQDLGIECITLRDDGPLDFAIPGRVRSALHDWNCDVLESHGYKATAAAYFLKRTGLDIPWIGFFHGETHEDLKAHFYHALDRRFLRSADRAVVMSERQRVSIGTFAPNILVLYNAITGIERRARGGDADRVVNLCHALPRPRIAVIGRLSPEKGVDVFIDACVRLVQRGFEFGAVIAGDGPDRRALEQWVTDNNLDDRVVLAGHVDDVAALYENIDLLVLPSRSEGLPNVLLEAIAWGIPVVATDVGAVADVLDDPAAGLIVASEDPPALADAIETAATASYANAGLPSRQRIAERFSLDGRTRRLVAIIHDVVARRPPRLQRGPATE